IQRRLDDALTQNPARPTHLPRFGKTLTGLTSRRTAVPKESSHRATQAKIHACQRSRLLMATLRAWTEHYPAGAWRGLVSRQKSFRFTAAINVQEDSRSGSARSVLDRRIGC